MWSLAGALPLLGLAYALPQESCVTVTTEVIQPTTTTTYSSTDVVTVYPTTAENLGTFTYVTTISSTTTLETVTSTSAVCAATGVVTEPYSTTTVYSSTAAPKSKRAPRLYGRDGCTVTVTTTTTYGQTYTFVPAGKTRTFYDYTTFTDATVYATTTGGRAYAIASATATTPVTCGASTVTPTGLTTTTTLDARCSPAAMTSAYQSYGLEFLSDTPSSGATYMTNTDDASSCCQLCAEADQCAASAWDIRTGQCRLEFPVDFESGSLNCGEGLLAYYDAGPISPMSPGTGWFVAPLCGNVEFGSAPPDDGT